jgi:hypothetical protein
MPEPPDQTHIASPSAQEDPNLDRQDTASAKRWWKVHRLLSGGVLGRYGEYARVSALLSTSQDALWTSIHPAVSLFFNGVWHTHPGDETLVYRDGHWQRFGDIDTTSPHRLVWYRDAIWGIDFRANNLVFCDGQTWQLVPSLPFAAPWCLAVDSAGYLWVGTQGDGLWRTHDTQHWERIALPHYHEPHQPSFITALHCPHPDTIVVADCNNMWRTSTICRYEQERWEIVPLPPRPRTFRLINALMVDTSGGIWLGLTHGGVWSWNGKKWRRHATQVDFYRRGVPGFGIISFHIDQKQRLWVVTGSGVGYYEHRRWYSIILALSMPDTNNRVNSWLWPQSSRSPACAHLDEKGRLWIGTRFGEIGWIDTTQTAYPYPELLEYPNYKPNPIHIDE